MSFALLRELRVAAACMSRGKVPVLEYASTTFE